MNHSSFRFSAIAMVGLFAVACASFSGGGKVAEEEIDGRTVKIELLEEEQIDQYSGEPGLMKIIWATQSEEDNFGFIIMRGPAEEGPFERINEQILLGAGDSSTENWYKYFDLDVKVGDKKYYYIESVSTSGVREQFSPILFKKINRRILN